MFYSVRSGAVRYNVLAMAFYPHSPQWGKIEYRTAEDFRTLPNFTGFTVVKVNATENMMIIQIRLFLKHFKNRTE